MEEGMYRKSIIPGQLVEVVLKKDQRTGKLTKGRVDKILTNKPVHTQGIKVMLTDGRVGRVKVILSE